MGLFLLLMLCSSGETAFCRELMDFPLRVGEPLPKLVARLPYVRKGSQKWPAVAKVRAPALLYPHICAWRKAPKAFDANPSPCPRCEGVWGAPALPCTPTRCELHFLMEEKQEFQHSWPNNLKQEQTISSLGQFISEEIRYPQNWWGLLCEKNNVRVLIYNAIQMCFRSI